MNRIKFDAKILDLYSVDYDYLQDSIEDEVAKLLRQAIANPGEAGIIKGFKLKVSPSNSSKVMIYSNGTWNSAFSNDGIMVETEDDIDLISPSASGVINYIYVRSYTVDGTYNKKAGVIEEGVQKAIDYYDYARVYDRLLDAWEIVVYTLAEYLSLTDEERYALIYVGSFLATTPVTAISTSGRSNMKTFIADGSVTTDSISTTDMLLPQVYVDNSETIVDTYPVTFEPANLEEDLNKIRSIMRSVRGTAIWDEYDTNNLRVFDSSISALHSDGVFENVLDELDVIPNSTGLSVIITAGKALTNGVLQSISDLSRQTKDIEPQPSYHITTEDHSIGVIPPGGTYVTLNYQNVAVSSVYGNFGGGYLGVPGTDYITYSSTGSLFIPYTTNFNPVYDIYVTYSYGFMRYDVIEIGPNLNVQVVQGISATSNGTIPNVPIPPDVPVTDPGYVPLAVIKVVPNISRFDYNHINFYKRYTPWMRDLLFIPCYDTTNIQTSVNRIAYHKTNTTVDEFNLNWTSSTYDNMTYYQSTTDNTFITTAVMCYEDDEVWLLVDKSIESNSIYVEWNALETETAYDSNITLDLQWRYPLHYYPIKVTKGLSTGIHKFKITKMGSNSFKFYGVLVGKPDTFYQNYSQTEIETYFKRFLAEDTSNNIAIGINTIPSGIAGTDVIAIGQGALASTTVGVDDIAIGTNALTNNVGGLRNFAAGTNALTDNTEGDDNIAIGKNALGTNIIGNNGVAIGSGALINSKGDDNIAIGKDAGSSVTSVSGTITIGAISGANTANTTYIGNIYNDTITLPNPTSISPNVVIGSNGRLQRAAYTGAPPIGSIIAWLPGYFLTGTYVEVVSVTLPTEWKVCDGAAVTDTESPIFSGAGAGKNLPTLNDNRFLMGGSGTGIGAIGYIGGNNNIPAGSITQATYTVPLHNHQWYDYTSPTGGPYDGYSYNAAGSSSIITTASVNAFGIRGEAFGVASNKLHTDYYTRNIAATTLSANTALSFSANVNLPQYIACKYIMRIK